MTHPSCGRERGKANRSQDHAASEDQHGELDGRVVDLPTGSAGRADETSRRAAEALSRATRPDFGGLLSHSDERSRAPQPMRLFVHNCAPHRGWLLGARVETADGTLLAEVTGLSVEIGGDVMGSSDNTAHHAAGCGAPRPAGCPTRRLGATPRGPGHLVRGVHRRGTADEVAATRVQQRDRPVRRGRRDADLLVRRLGHGRTGACAGGGDACAAGPSPAPQVVCVGVMRAQVVVVSWSAPSIAAGGPSGLQPAQVICTCCLQQSA